MLVKVFTNMHISVKEFHQHKFFTNIHFSPTSFTNIHISWLKCFSPTYIKIFTNIIHQHTYIFEWADLFSPTYYFTNIIFTNIMKFRGWMLVKVLYQHTGFSPTCIFHQHPSPTLKQPRMLVKNVCWRKTCMMVKTKISN